MRICVTEVNCTHINKVALYYSLKTLETEKK